MSSIFKKIWEFVVDACLEEGEPYAIRSRKLAIIAFSFITFNAILLGIPVQTITQLYDPSMGMKLCGGAALQVGVTSAVIPYTYMRVTRKLPDWIADLQIWSVVPMTFLFSLFNHHSSVTVVNTICIFVGLVMRIRGWYALIGYGVCIHILHALINDFTGELPKLHETFHSTPLLSIRLLYLIGGNICPLIFFGMGLHVIMDESVERADQADAAIAMNLAVADKLRRYDTDGVSVILAANKGKVDERLLEAFAGIQQNLEEYRPHIPNYVIAATTIGIDEGGETDDNEDDEGAFTITGSSTNHGGRNSLFRNDDSLFFLPPHDTLTTKRKFSRSTNSSNNRDNTNNYEEEEDAFQPSPSVKIGEGSTSDRGIRVEDDEEEDNKEEDTTSSPTTKTVVNANATFATSSRRGSSSIVLAHLLPAAPKEATTSDTTLKWKILSDPIVVVNSRRRSSSLEGDRGDGLSTTIVKQRPHYSGRVTTVFVRFVSSGGGFTVARGKLAISTMHLLSKCVDAASYHAKAHKGALQYMQGCGLMVSFNAASRVATHEANACEFALALKASVDDLPYAGLIMHAAIVTTNALSFFAGNSGQLMLTVLGGFMPVHTAMHHYLSQTVGNAASCVLVSNTLLPTIDMLFDHRLLGGVVVTTLPTTAPPPHRGGSECNNSNNHKPTIITSTTTTIGISELLSSKNTGMEGSGENDEWLYHHHSRKKENENDPILLSNKAVRAALDGDAIPVEFSTQCDTSDVVLMKCVKERLEACRKGAYPFEVVTISTVMW